jgi:hypothetical protein
MLLLLAALLGARFMAAGPPGARGRREPWTTLGLAVAAALAVGTFEFPNRWPVRESAAHVEGQRLYHEIYDAVHAHAAARSAAAVRAGSPKPGTLVVMTFTGIVNETNLEYRALKNGARIYFKSIENTKSIAEYEPWLAKTDFVLAAQSHTGLTNDRFPSGKLHDEVVARIEGADNFRLVASFRGLTPGREFRLYERVKGPGKPRPAPESTPAR